MHHWNIGQTPGQGYQLPKERHHSDLRQEVGVPHIVKRSIGHYSTQQTTFMFNPVPSGMRPELMMVGAFFGSSDGRTVGSPPWKADITRGRNTRNEVIRGIKNKIIKKSLSGIYICKGQEGVKISMARENPAQSARSKFQREEPE